MEWVYLHRNSLNEFDDQLKVQRNISMVVLRNLGYGKKSIEHKVCLETQHLIDAIKVYNHSEIYG